MLQIRVAHFEPDKIFLTGEGVFPRIMFDLPLDKEDERFNDLVDKAKENIKNEKDFPAHDKAKEEVPLRAMANVSMKTVL
jgi:hypothetical protein